MIQTVTSSRALPRGWGLSPRRVCVYEYLNHIFSASKGREIRDEFVTLPEMKTD